MNDTSDTCDLDSSFAEDFSHELVSDAQINRRRRLVETFLCRPLTVVLGAALCLAAMDRGADGEPSVAKDLRPMDEIDQCSPIWSGDPALHLDLVIHVTLDPHSLEVLDAWTEMNGSFAEEVPYETDPGCSVPLDGDDTIWLRHSVTEEGSRRASVSFRSGLRELPDSLPAVLPVPPR